jgi:hypothetical protein
MVLRGMWLTLNTAQGIASDPELFIGWDDVGMQTGVFATYLSL